ARAPGALRPPPRALVYRIGGEIGPRGILLYRNVMRPRATRLSKRFEIRPRMGRMTPDALTGAPAAVPADAPYKDPTLPVDARIRDLLSRMTLAEKVGQMLQLDARGGV